MGKVKDKICYLLTTKSKQRCYPMILHFNNPLYLANCSITQVNYIHFEAFII